MAQTKHTFHALKQLLQHFSEVKHFDNILKNVTLVSTTPGHCVCQFKVDEPHLNGFGTLHGGFTSTLIDCITTLALLSTEAGSPGVSVNLNVNFLKAAKLGEEVTIAAKVLKHGKTLAFTEALLTNSDGVAIATGQHVKHIG